MVTDEIRTIVKNYLRAAHEVGIHAHRAIVYGSYARGEANEWSDIDLVVIAPELDNMSNRDLIHRLWKLTAHTDVRIEPVPCGLREWESGDACPMVEIARREGVEISLDDESTPAEVVGK